MEKPEEQRQCTVALEEDGLYDVCRKAAERTQRTLEEAAAALAEARATLYATANNNTEQGADSAREGHWQADSHCCRRAFVRACSNIG